MPPSHTLPEIYVSGRPTGTDYRILTPRTPHSRAGRAEEGFTEVELQAFQDDESNDYRSQLQQQSQPLLSPGYRSRGDEHDVAKDTRSVKYWALAAWNKLPLIGGSVLAFALLVLIGVSMKSPGSLEAAVLQTPAELLKTAEAPISTSPSPSIEASLETATPQVSIELETTGLTSEALSPSATPTSSQHDMDMSPRPFISYENYTSFPLTGEQYREQCDEMMKSMHHGDYWDEPRMGAKDVEHHNDTTNYQLPEGEFTKVCTSTVTYMLDGHVGLAADLTIMAQIAALARDRNSTFLIDDTYWTRGKWTDYFQNVRALEPGPEPGCGAPPPNELVACPRTARHWVVSSRTAGFHLGHAFGMQFEEGHGHNLNRIKPIFERARNSLENVIRPNKRMVELIRAAREEVVSILSAPALNKQNSEQDIELEDRASEADGTSKKHEVYIGVHIRRGDRKPFATPYYPDGTIPIQRYVDAARATWDKFFGHSSVLARDVSSMPVPPIMWLASDSPPAARQFAEQFPAKTGIFSLEHSAKSELRALAPAHEYVQSEFDQEPAGERARLTKGMIVDLAMVSGLWATPGDVAPGAVVCALGSNVCKVSTYAFDFDRAFGFDDDGNHYMGEPNPERARWVDVDNAGRVIPAWKPFD